ncbi:tyrosine-type recombinase/integrase [Hyphomonas sp. BRH_c22]|uniref:tyrosine-type recombinase/integrase n=1 Tax=Hyphomonas sp. BRH_c22 TaxID=1629710 RepID=UPI0005F1E1D7|nr:tyrosine-type recombinase/integrase [Hyphomonas sp. BRH_c22]
MSIFKRSNCYQLRRRVPRRYRSVEPRGTIWVSLHTDSETVARSKADRVWSQLIEAWEARLAGDTAAAEKRYEAAQELARIRGFRYLDIDLVSRLPVEALLQRVEAIRDVRGVPDTFEASALLGTVQKPRITVEAALDIYWTLAREKVVGKSEHQVRRWKNPRIKAVRNFVEVVGNKPIDAITRDDMLDFRQFWLERIEAAEVTPNSANKDLIHLGDVLKTVNNMKRLGLDLPLGELSFREGEKSTRPPFSVDWIRKRLLAPGALSGLNDEARGLLLGMVNTGYRPSEGAGLTTGTIHLGHDIPHISIEPIDRQLKTRHSRRVIPLAGVSLEAFREFPNGFPRYRDSASLSGTVNKYLKENGLLETPEHSFYSLRHAFEDRMIEAGIDDRIRRDLFGHRLDRERYGKGASLAHLAKLVEGIAL